MELVDGAAGVGERVDGAVERGENSGPVRNGPDQNETPGCDAAGCFAFLRTVSDEGVTG